MPLLIITDREGIYCIIMEELTLSSRSSTSAKRRRDLEIHLTFSIVSKQKELTPVGITYIKGDNEKHVTVRFLVDSGATYQMQWVKQTTFF